MKRLFPLMAIVACMLVSCAKDDNPSNNNSAYNGIIAEVSPMETVAEVATRSSLSFSPTEGMMFTWNDPEPNPDVLTVFPSSGAASGLYTLTTMLNESNTLAQFTASGFSLSKDMRYYALSKKEDKGAHPNWNFPSARNITVDYSGQRQTESGDYETSHLGEYDFMVATDLCENQDEALFNFKHLGLTLRMILKGLPNGVEYTELEIYDSENTFRQPIRTINLENGLDAQGNYNPAYNELDENNPSYNERFTLALGADEDHGITPTADDGSGHKKLIAYIELPPFDFTGKDIVFSLKSKDGAHNYYGTYAGYKLNAGKAYQMTVNMVPATTYVVNVKVAYNWQLGNTNDDSTPAKTRGTGDPGNDDGFEAPNYIYAFFCVDNTVQDYRQIEVTHSGNNAWTDPDLNNVITYKTQLTFSADNPTDAASARVYIAASRTALTIPVINSGATPETSIQGIDYSIQGVATSPNVNAPIDASQQFLRDLYSTPWQSNETFVGKLTDPYQDITLYHVAAKVDLKWNSTAILSGNVSANSVKSEQLFLFKPTTNTSATNSNYTVKTPITTGTQTNGRQHFYLPQFNTYNTTIGSNTQDVTFTPATTNGFTSWLRWLKKY